MRLSLRIGTVLLAGIVAIALMSKIADAGKIINLIRNMEKKFVFLALISQIVIIFATSVRWSFLLKKANASVEFKNIIKLVLVSYFINCLTPGAKIGGDASRVYFLNRIFSIEVSRGAATIFAERISDFFIFISIAFTSLIFITFIYEIDSSVRNKISLILLFFLLLYTGAIKAIFSEKLAKKIGSRLPKRFNFFENFLIFKRRSYSLLGKNIMIPSLFFTMIIWFFEILRTFLVLKSLGEEVPFLAVAVVTVITLSLATLPILPGNVGITEGIIATLYYSLGLPIEASVSLAIVDRLLSYWLVFILGGISFLSLDTHKNSGYSF